MNIVVAGAHPDDAECACGGLIWKAVCDGHKVHFLVFTNGDKGGKAYGGLSLPEVREQEARAAAEYAGAEIHFLGYRDRELPFNEESLNKVCEKLKSLEPDVILAHWPTDNHPDHQICGVLITQAIQQLPGVGLAYYEATIGWQTFGMSPNRYLDISDVVEKKRRMTEFHQSQNVPVILQIHEQMERWYGVNMGVEFAETYYMHKSTRKAEELFLPKE